MGDSDKKCCLCFPLECGVLTLAILTGLGAIIGLVTCFTQDGAWGMYGVGVISQVLMALVFIFAYSKSDESSRKFTLLAWIVLVVVVSHVWYLYIILNGSYFENICHEEVIQEINAAGVMEPFTVDECRMGGKKAVWADFVCGLLFSICFATVIQTWSENEDGYQKA